MLLQINGKKVKRAGLRPDDVIQIGNTRIRFYGELGCQRQANFAFALHQRSGGHLLLSRSVCVFFTLFVMGWSVAAAWVWVLACVGVQSVSWSDGPGCGWQTSVGLWLSLLDAKSILIADRPSYNSTLCSCVCVVASCAAHPQLNLRRKACFPRKHPAR